MAGTMRWLEVLVVGVYTLEQTGSAFMVALMLFVRAAPMLVMCSLMGALADRIDRRKLLIAGMLGATMTSGPPSRSLCRTPFRV